MSNLHGELIIFVLIEILINQRYLMEIFKAFPKEYVHSVKLFF